MTLTAFFARIRFTIVAVWIGVAAASSSFAAKVYFNHGYQASNGATYTTSSNSITFNTLFAGKSLSFTTADPAALNFDGSGNDVAGTLTYITASGAPVSVTGTISRRETSGSTIRAFYFVTSSASTNNAYLLVVTNSTAQNYFGGLAKPANVGTNSAGVRNFLNDYLTSQGNLPLIAANNIQVTEGTASPLYAVFRVSLSRVANGNVTFTPKLFGNTATIATTVNPAVGTAGPPVVQGDDVYAESTIEYSSNGTTWTALGAGSITIPQNYLYVDVRVRIVDDTVIESTETFTLWTQLLTAAANVPNDGGAFGVATITDNDVANTAPVGNNDNGTVAEDTVLAGNVLANDTDAQNNVLSVTQFTVAGDATVYSPGSMATLSGKGTLQINGNGTYVFTPSLNFNGAIPVVTYTLSDGLLTATAALTVTVSAVNDAPINTVPASLGTTENSVVTLAGFSVADVDAGTSPITVTFSAPQGTLAATSNGTVTATGSGTGSLQLSGAAPNITAFLAAGSVAYTPATHANGNVVLTMISNDGGNVGSGGALTDVDTVTISIGAVNTAPVNTVPAVIAISEDVPSALTGMGVSDVDAGSSAITLTFAVPVGTLSALPDANVGRTGTGTGTLVLTGTTANLSSFLAAGGVIYTPVPNATGDVTLTVTSNDGGNTGAGGPLTDTDSVTLHIIPVNDAPMNTVPATLAVTEDVASVLTGISVTDVDAGTSNLTLTFSVPAGTLTASAGGNVGVAGSGTGSLVLTGTVANLNAFLAANNLSYLTAQNASGSVVLTMTANDGDTSGSGGLTDTDTITLNIGPVNDAPINTLPAAVAANGGVATPLSSVSVNDPDAGSSPITVSFNASVGTLSAAPAGGVTVTGTGSATVVLTGTATNLNSFLAGGALTYLAPAGVNAAAVITVTTNDGGNTGSGGALTDSDSIAVTITSANTPPVNGAPASIAVTEDVASALSGISVSDADAGSAEITLSLGVPTGTLTATPAAGIGIIGSGTGALTLTGSTANLTAYLSAGSVSYLTALNANGTVTLTVTSNDGGNTGPGGALTDVDTVTLAITPVNDRPTATAANVTVNANTPTPVTLAGTDVEGTTLQFVVVTQPLHGTLSGSAPNLTYTPSPGYVGSDSLTFTVSDGNLESVSAVINLSVQLDPAAPHITSSPVVTFVLSANRTNQSNPDFTAIELTPADVQSANSTTFSVMPTADPAKYRLTGSDIRKINFDTTPTGVAIPSGALLTNQYESLGVLMNSIPVSNSVYGGPASAPNTTLPAYVVGSQQIFTFTVPVVAFGVINTSPDQDGIDFFDQDGNPLFSTRDHAPDSNTDRFVGARVNDGRLIGKVIMTNAGGSYELDEMIFEVLSDQILPGQYSYDVEATDPASRPITYSLVSAPSLMRINASTGVIKWLPGASDLGSHTITVRATNNLGLYDSQTYTVTVIANHAPTLTAGPDLAIRTPAEALVLRGAASDDGIPAANSLSLTWSVVHGPGGVQFSDEHVRQPTATFTASGLYVLQLLGTDGVDTVTDLMEVRVGPSTAAEPASGIAAWWPGNGHPREMINGGHDIVGGNGYGPGAVAQGFVFNGAAGNSATVAAHVDHDIGASAAGFTVEFWVKPTALQDGTILSWGAPGFDGLQILQYDSGRSIMADLRERTNGGDVYATSSLFLAAGAWAHYALTYDRAASLATVYVNGAVVTRTSIASRAVRTQYGLSFGRKANDQSHPWSGTLDEVSLYKRPLTQEEVIGIFQAGAFGKTPPDDNTPPTVDAGPDLNQVAVGQPVALGGVVQDDQRPFGAPTISWTVVQGDANSVTFANQAVDSTTATFATPGLYVLKLTASDGLTQAVSRTKEVRVGTVNAAEPVSGLAAWWPGNGHPRELVNGGHDVKFVNGEGYAPGQVSQGFYFNAVANGRAEVAAHADHDIGASTAGFTVEFWVKPSALQDGTILQWGAPGVEGLQIFQYDSGRAIWANLRERGNGSDANVASSQFVTANAWAHYALTYDRATAWATIYVNGVVVNRTQLASRAVRTQYDLFFGRKANDQTNAWRGTLDEVSLYKRPLTQDEVVGIYQAGAFGKTPPDDNTPPTVDAGPDLNQVAVGQSVALGGVVQDDQRPFGAPTTSWSVVQGDANAVTFANQALDNTTATFATPGLFVLKLTASDGQTQAVSDTKEVRVGTTNAAEPVSGIAAWWPGNGHPRELINGGHDVKFVNGEGYVAGQVSQAFYFNAVNQGRAEVAAHADHDIGASTTGFTVEFWVKPSALQDGTILQWGAPGVEGLQIFQYDSGRAIWANLRERTNGGDANVASSQFVAANTWSHYALTYDRATAWATVYVNGVVVNRTQIASRAVRTQYDLSFGRKANDQTQAWRGTLDEVTLYKRPLTQDEIAGIYQSGTFGKTPPDDNTPPTVDAGPDLNHVLVGQSVALGGVVQDDQRPFGAPTAAWTVAHGQVNSVTFGDPAVADTTATFATPGLYVLKLTGSDRQTQAVSDLKEVRVGVTNAAEPASGISAWWPGNGHPRELINGGHDVKFVNGEGYVAGQVSQAFYFNAVNQGRAEVAAHADHDIGASTAGFTVEFWVKPSALQDGTILQWGAPGVEGLQIFQYDSGRAIWANLRERSSGGDANIASSQFVTANSWSHYALTYDRATTWATVYVNGVAVTRTQIASRAVRTQYDLSFGRKANDQTHAWRGTLDEVTLYKRPLSQDEIKGIYQAGAFGKEPLDDNTPPVVDAGPDLNQVAVGQSIPLGGVVLDDQRPFGAPTVGWSMVHGPANSVSYADQSVANTTASFAAAGLYVLKLTATDGLTQPVSDTKEVRVGITTAATPPSGLVAWWPGNAHPRELITGGHDVKFVNGEGYAVGKVSQGFYFDALANSRADVAAHADHDIGASTAGFTVEFWVSPTQLRDGTILSWGAPGIPGLQFFQYDSGRVIMADLRERSNGSSWNISSSLYLTAGVWAHYALTYDRASGAVTVYANGVAVANQTLASRAVRTQYDLSLGRNAWDQTAAWKGVLDEVSLYNRALTASEITAIYQAAGAGKIPPAAANAAPLVALDDPISGSSVVINTPVTLSALATDSDGTITKVEFFDDTTKIGESTAAEPGQPQLFRATVSGFAPLGRHTLTARATDNLGATATSANISIEVVPVLPNVALTAPTNNASVAALASYTMTATATYSAGTLSRVEFYDGLVKVGESTAPVNDSYSVVVPDGLTAGAHTLKAKAIATNGASAMSAPVTVTATTLAPTVALTSPANNSTVPANSLLTLAATAADSDGAVAKVEFFRDGVKLGEDLTSPYTYGVVGGFAPGNYILTAKATDNSGLSTTSAAITVTSTAYTGSPVADIASPDNDARITSLTDIKGVIAHQNLASWVLEYRLKSAEGATPEPWVQLAAGASFVGTPAVGTTPAVPATIASFDPTRLINGIYELQLRVTGTGGDTSFDHPVNEFRTLLIEGNMKVGAFSIAFEDLKLPVAGIPITVTRTYDSRDTRLGDFGPGWRLALNNVRIQKNRNLGTNWYQTPAPQPTVPLFYPFYVTPQSQRIVTVTMPDGETHRFRGGALVRNYPGTPDDVSTQIPATTGKYKFYPLGDTTASLEPLNTANQLADTFYIYGTGDQALMDGEPGDPDAEPFNTTRFRLTTSDGTVFILDETLGLLEMRDLDGNTLALNRDAQNRVTGVTSTQNAPSGPIARSVAIVRDATGRVDYIRDPANKDLDYLYDAQGRLASFTNRESNITQFRYENATFPYYLTKIIDPRGTTALRSEYDAAGKLVKQIDADGKETIFNRGAGIDAASRFEKVKDRLGSETTFFYDERGNVTLKIDPLGAQTTFSYYPDSERVKFETDHYGNVKSMAYDARGNVVAQTIGASLTEDPANPTTGYTSRTTYNDQSAPTQITDPEGRVQTFTYDPATNNLLTHTIGAGGSAPATTTYTYKSDGTVDTITDAQGNATSHAYNYAFSDSAFPGAVKQITITVTDPAGALGSDPSNAAATVLRSTRSLFDAQENQVAQIVTRTLPGGASEDVITRFAYDTENRLRATILPDGRVTETRYTSFGKEDKTLVWKNVTDYQGQNDANARITTFGYDARGNQTSVTHADNTTELTGLDLENRKIWSQDRRGYRTFFVYDAMGRLRFTIHPDANDGVGAGAPASATDQRLADNPRTETVYDLAGRVTDTYDELRRRTQTVYFPDGTPNASRRQQTVSVRSVGNLVTSYQYDKSGNVRFVTDPRGNATETRYDDSGRPNLVIYPATDEHPSTQTGTKYDLLGRRVEVSDQEGKVTRYRYDGLGRLTEVRQYIDQSLAASDVTFSLAASTSGLAVTRYTHDALGNQQTQTDALGRTTTYWTDAVGRRTQRILPKDTGEATNFAETLQYDEWGNLWKRTDFAGKTTTFSYDALNRLKSKTADATHPSLTYSHAIARIEYDYDANGGRTAARTFSASNTQLYTESTPHDERGRLTYKDTAGGRLDYTYYANNRLKDVVSSNAGGVNVGYRYDEVNRLEGVDDTSTGMPVRSTAYTYNANGSLESVTAPNSVVHTYSYDALNRLRTLNINRGATAIHAYNYKLRASGHRREVVENATRTAAYAYDDLYRLTSETITGDTSGNNGTIGYSLDKVGNRLARNSQVAALASQLSQTYNARDWLNGDTYSANGSTVSSPAFAALNPSLAGTDTYDFEERLIVRTRPDGSTINVNYNADGIRITKNILSPTAQPVTLTSWLVDTNNLTGYAQVFEERITQASATTQKVYTYGTSLISQAASVDGQPVSVSYYAHDGHGNVRELTNAAGSVTDRYDYDAFGNVVFQSGATTNAYRYCGEQYDSDLGLYYNRARYLNADSGKFWSADSFEGFQSDPISLHRYLYANANPITGFDPSGRFTLNDAMLAVWNVGMQALIAIPRVAPTLYAAGKAIAAVATVALPAINIYLFATNEEFQAMVVNTPGGAGMIAADIRAVMSVSRMVYEARFAILIAVEREAGYITEAVPVSKALKTDLYHGGGATGSTLTKQAAEEAGEVFLVKGGDGKIRVLTQIEGSQGGKSGIFEYLVEDGGTLTHARFREGATIDGKPNGK